MNMFSKNSKQMAKHQESDSQAYNLIDAGTVLKGDIETKGNIRIDGTLVGTIRSKGKVVVGPSGKVEGEIECQNADISGTLKAKIKVGQLLSLKSTANIYGDIQTQKLSIEPGANFTGTCSMGGMVKELSDADKQKQKEIQEQSA
jgi:cytoskeletal protein CcmA (bactofilin family)